MVVLVVAARRQAEVVAVAVVVVARQRVAAGGLAIVMPGELSGQCPPNVATRRRALRLPLAMATVVAPCRARCRADVGRRRLALRRTVVGHRRRARARVARPRHLWRRQLLQQYPMTQRMPRWRRTTPLHLLPVAAPRTSASMKARRVSNVLVVWSLVLFKLCTKATRRDKGMRV